MDLGSTGYVYGTYEPPAFIGLDRKYGFYSLLLHLWGALGKTQVNRKKYAVSFVTM